MRQSDKRFVTLRHKHSVVESAINCLEHHGLDRCPDQGIRHFKTYVAVGVLATNIHQIGAILQKKAFKQDQKQRKRLKLVA